MYKCNSNGEELDPNYQMDYSYIAPTTTFSPRILVSNYKQKIERIHLTKWAVSTTSTALVTAYSDMIDNIEKKKGN